MEQIFQICPPPSTLHRTPHSVPFTTSCLKVSTCCWHAMRVLKILKPSSSYCPVQHLILPPAEPTVLRSRDKSVFEPCFLTPAKSLQSQRGLLSLKTCRDRAGAWRGQHACTHVPENTHQCRRAGWPRLGEPGPAGSALCEDST